MTRPAQPKAVRALVLIDAHGALTDIFIDEQPGLRLLRQQREPISGMVRVSIRPVPKRRRKARKHA